MMVWLNIRTIADIVVELMIKQYLLLPICALCKMYNGFGYDDGTNLCVSGPFNITLQTFHSYGHNLGPS